MNDKTRFSQLVEEVDFRLAHRRHLRERGVHLIVTHGYHAQGTLCPSGDIIEDIALGGQAHPLSFGLSHMSLLHMDCLCRFRLPLTAQGIEQIMNTVPFYVQHAANRIGRNQCIARPDRKSVRVYIPRIWSQMDNAFRKVGFTIDPQKVLFSGLADSNRATY